MQQQAQQEAQQVVYEPPAQPVAGEEGLVSAAPLMPEVNAMGQRVLSREERVEYRDQDGNLLDPEQVKALEGKVEFRTRYETRTRIVDAYGNEIAVHGEGEDARAVPLPPPPGYAPQDAGNAGAQQAVPEAAGVAPPHPDAEGVETQTGAKAVAAGKVKPDDPLPEGFKVKRAAAVNAEVSNDGENESERSKAKPASESGAEETA